MERAVKGKVAAWESERRERCVEGGRRQEAGGSRRHVMQQRAPHSSAGRGTHLPATWSSLRALSVGVAPLTLMSRLRWVVVSGGGPLVAATWLRAGAGWGSKAGGGRRSPMDCPTRAAPATTCRLMPYGCPVPSATGTPPVGTSLYCRGRAGVLCEAVAASEAQCGEGQGQREPQGTRGNQAGQGQARAQGREGGREGSRGSVVGPGLGED
ncbi:hypothetical protein E2C01_083504 [Portunus trituberculatus]|uniref:Uncharacterized protein n=1 Tax=Portunus trituberculatus TaxID=210409 RepID=A0A5B7J1Y2_PORTR|nr:hypothetical protein [Portunus trituberculatus]